MIEPESLLTAVPWLAMGGFGALAIWLRAQPRGAGKPRIRIMPWDRALYLRQGRPGQLRSYRVQAEAERRAEVLLREVIGESCFAGLVRRGYLEVSSPTFPSRVYLVPERQGPVTVCENGRPVMRLCVQTVERVPDYDAVIMHKLMIDGNEREYLRIANRV
ncbi:MAG: hypothetical protein ACR2NO_06805 [Chloroflexota bacterium]